MKLSKGHGIETPQIMIIPMIDIIFFLLVFFMLSTLYMTEQATMPVNLPAAASARQDVVKSLNVTVAKDGTVYLGKEKMSVEELKGRVTQEAKSGEAAVVLRADGDVEYKKFIAVMDELKTSGISRISLAAKQEAK